MQLQDVSVLELVRRAPLALALLNADGKLLASSRLWGEIIPSSPENRAVLQTVRERAREGFARCLAGACETIAPFPLHAGTDEERWVRMDLGPWRDEAGRVLYVMAHCWDVTEEEQRRRRLEHAEERLNSTLLIDRMVVKEFNVKTGKTVVLGPASPLRDALNGEGVDIGHIHALDRQRVAALVEAGRERSTVVPIKTEYRLNDDPDTWVSTVAKRFVDEAGEVERVMLISQDITERMKHRQEVERLAYCDSLTGLPNRARFQLAFDAAAAEAEAAGRRLALAMVDVDYFKDINDTLGHDAGDALLTALAEAMRKIFGERGLVARLGGDEFAILIRDLESEADVVEPLMALRSALAEPIQYRGQGIRIATSMGAAVHDDPDDDPERLLKNADIALYRAKTLGRDQLVMFEPWMRTQVEQRLELLRDVRAAIPRGEFTLFYQPVISLGESRVTGLEALMRWDHPDHGVLAPVHFMAALEDQDLSLQLDEVTIETALKQMRAWIEQGVDFGRISINLSPAQFRSGRLAKSLKSRLRRWGVPADRLTVEVTENVYLGWGAEAVGETVRELHDQGVTIALDDFGTGYASLANLRQFPIDRLKIDRSFVQNDEDDAIVRAVVNLGASMGLEVVAEGVEKPEQLNALMRYGCDHVQGYHFAKPMPALEVPAYIKTFANGRSQSAA